MVITCNGHGVVVTFLPSKQAPRVRFPMVVKKIILCKQLSNIIYIIFLLIG